MTIATGIVILAAGNSSRLGRPKQLLAFNGQTLLEHIIDEAVTANLHPVIIVTGANGDAVSAAISNKEAVTVYNKDWQQGMGFGIAAGVAKALEIKPDLESIITAVCDQPFIKATLSEQLMQKRVVGKSIVACSYTSTAGTPVLFDKKYFTALQNLSGSDGAKKFVKLYCEDVDTVPFPMGIVDIDTEEGFRNLLSLRSSEWITMAK